MVIESGINCGSNNSMGPLIRVAALFSMVKARMTSLYMRMTKSSRRPQQDSVGIGYLIGDR